MKVMKRGTRLRKPEDFIGRKFKCRYCGLRGTVERWDIDRDACVWNACGWGAHVLVSCPNCKESSYVYWDRFGWLVA
jgi:hypothetical protein